MPGDAGWLLVRLGFPLAGRYPDHPTGTTAPLVVQVPPYLTPNVSLPDDPDLAPAGVVQATFAWPGRRDPASGRASEGTFDYGGPAAKLVRTRNRVSYVRDTSRDRRPAVRARADAAPSP